MNIKNIWVARVATLGPLGKLPAAGTWGSLAGIVWYFIILRPLNNLVVESIVAAVSVAAAIKICDMASHHFEEKDPGEVVLDEFVSMPLTLIALSPFAGDQPLLVIVASFLLFRAMDILKPFGIRRLENLPGGLGIVLDDVAAALLAAIILLAILTNIG